MYRICGQFLYFIHDEGQCKRMEMYNLRYKCFDLELVIEKAKKEKKNLIKG